MSCKPFKTSEANAKAFLRTQGVIDNHLNILDLGKFRTHHSKLRQQAKDKYFPTVSGWNEKLFFESEDGTKAYPNKVVFKQIDNINGIKYSKFVTEDGAVDVEKTVQALSDKFSIPYKIINDPKEKYSGKFEDGRVYINMAYVTAETAWHEFAHPFIEQVKDDNIILYENLKKEIANTEYGQQVLKEVQKHYPELSIDEQFEEAIVETIARFATGKIDLETMKKNSSLFEKVIRFIEKIKEFIAKAINKEYAKNNNLKSGILKSDDINLIQKSGLSFKRKIDNENYTLKDFAQMMQYSYRINLKEYDRLETTKVKEEQTEILKNLTTDENKAINKFQELLRVLSQLTLQNYSIEKSKKENNKVSEFQKNYKGLTNVMKFAYGAYVFVNNKGATMNDIIIGLKQKYPQMFLKEIFDPLNDILTEIFSQTPDGSIVDLVTDGVVDSQKLEQYVEAFDYTKIDSFNERVVENSSKALSLIENSLWKIEQKKQIQFKNQWTVSDFGGVYHNIGAYMNNAGINTITDAINNFVTLLSSGNRVELATYSAKSDQNILRGAVKIGFKPNAPVIYSYLQDVASYLVDTEKGKKRITDQKQNMRGDLEEELYYHYDELFLNATKDNIENLEILKSITDKEFDALKQLSELTGAPIIQNGKVLYAPTTSKEYKPESVKYSKFTNEQDSLSLQIDKLIQKGIIKAKCD